jgi:hypothetical protein
MKKDTKPNQAKAKSVAQRAAAQAKELKADARAIEAARRKKGPADCWAIPASLVEETNYSLAGVSVFERVYPEAVQGERFYSNGVSEVFFRDGTFVQHEADGTERFGVGKLDVGCECGAASCKETPSPKKKKK